MKFDNKERKFSKIYFLVQYIYYFNNFSRQRYTLKAMSELLSDDKTINMSFLRISPTAW